MIKVSELQAGDVVKVTCDVMEDHNGNRYLNPRIRGGTTPYQGWLMVAKDRDTVEGETLPRPFWVGDKFTISGVNGSYTVMSIADNWYTCQCAQWRPRVFSAKEMADAKRVAE